MDVFKGKGKKFVKRVKKKIPWVEHIINDVDIAGDLNIQNLQVRARRGSLCLVCRGSRMLCGKRRCPAIVKLKSFLNIRKNVDSVDILGSSPPGVFVGRIGYPYVYAGPLVPPILGDTSLFDRPESWIGRSVDEIIEFRTSLVRSKFRVNVKKPYKARKLMEKTLELAMAEKPVDTEVILKKKPSSVFFFDGEVQPMGPSAPLKEIDVSNISADRYIEKVYSDTDLKAEDAVLKLYLNKVPVSRIQRAFSVGAFGVGKQRRLVPTRWSITAVDSTISRRLIEEKVKGRDTINEYRVYEFSYLGNVYIVLLMPGSWSYEWIEAWYPGTVWNPTDRDIAMGGDWEGYKGRTTYASIGGCYYAVRLAVAEYLAKEGRQATVLAMREIRPGFITPLGVWINRESVRAALKSEYKKFSNMEDALRYIDSKFTIDIKNWIEVSNLLKNTLYQQKITDFIKKIKN